MRSGLSAGSERFLSSESPKGAWRAIFEDDGETAYFYACRAAKSGVEILDALQICQSPHRGDHGSPSSTTRIVWSSDGLKAGLVIGEQLHAVIDFARSKGFCRSNFPPASTAWGAREHWSDELLELIS
jgi:hypothetical protein